MSLGSNILKKQKQKQKNFSSWKYLLHKKVIRLVNYALTTYKKKHLEFKIFALRKVIRLVLNYACCLIQFPKLVTFAKLDSRKIDPFLIAPGFLFIANGHVSFVYYYATLLVNIKTDLFQIVIWIKLQVWVFFVAHFVHLWNIKNLVVFFPKKKKRWKCDSFVTKAPLRVQ